MKAVGIIRTGGGLLLESGWAYPGRNDYVFQAVDGCSLLCVKIPQEC